MSKAKEVNLTPRGSELARIKKYIDKAVEFHTDSKMSSESEKLANELYDSLFAYRDMQPERPLERSVEYGFIDIFKELKFGRTVDDQRYLQKTRG